jgi:hypothetical protein
MHKNVPQNVESSKDVFLLPNCTSILHFCSGDNPCCKSTLRSWLVWQMLANTSVDHGINTNILDDQMFIVAWKALGTLLTAKSCSKPVIVLQKKCKSEIETENELVSIF